jgi:hypothetical protein
LYPRRLARNERHHHILPYTSNEEKNPNKTLHPTRGSIQFDFRALPPRADELVRSADINTKPMKSLIHLLVVTLVCSASLVAELPGSVQGLLFSMALHALTKDGVRPPNSEAAKAVDEVSTLIQLDAATLAEFEALTDYNAGGSAVSEVILQELIRDYLPMAASQNQPVPVLIAYYISETKTSGLSPRERLLCYVMIKTTMRQSNALK